MPRASAAKAAVVEQVPAEPTTKSLRELLTDLRNSDKVVWVKNLTDGVIIIRSDPEANNDQRFHVVLTSPRRNDGGHIAILPKAALSHFPFQKLWRQRKVVLSDDEAMEDELLLAMSGNIERKPAMTTTNSRGETIPVSVQGNPLDNAVVVDVNAKGEATERRCLLTGQPVFQTQRQIDAGEPPLADHVKDKAYLFPGEQKWDDKTQKTYWSFPKVSIGMGG